MSGRAVLVPGALALLPEYASLIDPVADLRAACLSAVSWLGPGPVEVLGDAQGVRVGRALMAAGGLETVPEEVAQQPSRRAVAEQPPQPPGAAYLVVGNGSARRSEKAPGHFDPRAAGFDAALGAALLSSRGASWPDLELGEGQLASLDGIRALREVLPDGCRGSVDYEDDPFGVQYWVMRWQW